MVKISKKTTPTPSPAVPCPCDEHWFLCSFFYRIVKKKYERKGETFWQPIEVCLLIYVHFTRTFRVVLLFLKFFFEAIKCVCAVESIKLFAQSDFSTRLPVIFCSYR